MYKRQESENTAENQKKSAKISDEQRERTKLFKQANFLMIWREENTILLLIKRLSMFHSNNSLSV